MASIMYQRLLLFISFIAAFTICLLWLEIRFFTSTSPSIVMDNFIEEESHSNLNRRLNAGVKPNTNVDYKTHELYDASYDWNRDWFNASAWHSDTVVNFSCPVYENICVFNQHFYVHDKHDQFDLKYEKATNLLGTGMPNVAQTGPIYKGFFHGTVWADGEYANTKCYYHDVYTHMILQANYQTMLGEFYSRTLRFLHYLLNQRHLITNDIQLWLLIGDQKALFVSHHLFSSRFTHYSLQHFATLFDRIACECYHRVIFCGFQKEGHEIPWPRKDRKGSMKTGDDIVPKTTKTDDRAGLHQRNNHTNLLPLKTLLSRMEPEQARSIFPGMIVEYNAWVDAMDPTLAQDVRHWKYEQLVAYFVDHPLHAHNEKFRDVSARASRLMHEIDEWKFIGLYDRKLRRSWLEIEEHQLQCNEKYIERKIFCHIIVLEPLHSREVIVVHRASFMLIGVHGAQLTDAIWMGYDDEQQTQNKYIIELLPFNAPAYTSSIDRPTALGVIFWDSHYIHVGLKLSNASAQNPRKHWDNNNFYVQWSRLSKVIEFLAIDGGGMCQKYKRADRVQVPVEIDNFGFAIYNAFCIANPKIYHGVEPPRLF